jgi:hypothetical protein
MDTVDDFISGYCDALNKPVTHKMQGECVEIVDITQDDEDVADQEHSWMNVSSVDTSGGSLDNVSFVSSDTEFSIDTSYEVCF